MGAEQSSNRGAAQANAAPQKTCYYELLSVERTATDDEIKKSYRRKALELHPDRNINDTANATRKFAEVQTAYEILSDPQERAWYDSHRDAILRGDSATDDGGAGGGADAGPRYYNNVRLTPTEELYMLMGRFNSSVPFTDAPTGFFGILEATFAQLALEEEAAYSWDGGSSSMEPPQYPPFGSAGDDYDAVAKPFYRDWSNFATQKSFSWKDKYRLSDAPDRTVRRLMEKENKKARELAVREFNDAVRSLVAFVRKRDPRYVPNTQTEAERQKILRDSAAAQAARQRAANQERRAAAQQDYVEPGWARRTVGDDGHPVEANAADEHEGGFSSDSDEEVHHEIECVVCNKSFKSEKQFEAHEKSKKHAKAVQQLRWQMKKESKILQLDEEQEEDGEDGEDADEQPLESIAEEAEPEAEASQNESEKEPARQDSGKDGDRMGDDDGDEEEGSSDENDEYAPRDVVENRFVVGNGKNGKPAADAGESGSDADIDGLAAKVDGLEIKQGLPAAKNKVGKAKAKREKKAARQAATDEDTTTCKICNETFTSNTKLHRHLRIDHPAPAATGKGGKGKKKKGG